MPWSEIMMFYPIAKIALSLTSARTRVVFLWEEKYQDSKMFDHVIKDIE